VLGIGLLDSVLKLNLSDGYLMLCGMLGIVLEVVALGCGIVGRRSASGKAGLIISPISLVLYVLLTLTVLATPVHSTHGPEPGAEMGMEMSAVPLVQPPAPTQVPPGQSAAAPVAPAGGLEIRYDKSRVPSISAPGRSDYAFTFTAPPGHFLTAWLEFWQDGKLEIGDLDTTVSPNQDKPLTAVLQLSIANGETLSPESADKWRYDWTFADSLDASNGRRRTNGQWRKDIHHFRQASITEIKEIHVFNKGAHPNPGETVTLFSCDAYISDTPSMNEHTISCLARLLKGKPEAVVALRARISPAAPGELAKNPQTFADGPVKQELAHGSLSQFAIATEIGDDLRLCKTPAEAHRALVARAGTQEGRALAEQMLREFGEKPAAGVTPEELVKKLEETIEAIGNLSIDEAKRLIPKAASMPNAGFQKLATSPQATPGTSDDQPLSLIFMSLRPGEAAKRNPAALDDFQYLEAPMPSRIAEAASKSKSKGYATLIQPEFITNCTCSAKDDTATGTVSFAAPGLYSGKVAFVARRASGTWRIEEFRLPNYGIKTVRGADGKWKKSEVQP
jgi:hypothetical protein